MTKSFSRGKSTVYSLDSIQSRAKKDIEHYRMRNMGTQITITSLLAKGIRGTERFLKTAKLRSTSKLNTWLSRQDRLQPHSSKVEWLYSVDPLTVKETSKGASIPKTANICRCQRGSTCYSLACLSETKIKYRSVWKNTTCSLPMKQMRDKERQRVWNN